MKFPSCKLSKLAPRSSERHVAVHRTQSFETSAFLGSGSSSPIRNKKPAVCVGAPPEGWTPGPGVAHLSLGRIPGTRGTGVGDLLFLFGGALWGAVGMSMEMRAHRELHLGRLPSRARAQVSRRRRCTITPRLDEATRRVLG